MNTRFQTYWVRTTADGSDRLRADLAELLPKWSAAPGTLEIGVARHEDVVGDVMVFLRLREGTRADDSVACVIERYLQRFGLVSCGKWVVETGLSSPDDSIGKGMEETL